MLLKQEQDEQKKLDPRVVRTRQLLQDALMALMMEKSFRAITVQEIAERATVNRVTFYAHYKDKYELLEFAVRDLIRQQLRRRVPEDAPFSQQNVIHLMTAVCEFLAEMDRTCPPPHGQLQPLMEKQMKAELYEILRTWLAEMSADASERRPTPEQAAMVTSWAIYGAALQWSQQKQPDPASDFVQQVLPLILAGLQSAT